MMYLSRVRVESGALDMRALHHLMQGDQYGNHQLLWQLFPDQSERLFLFRQELETESTHHVHRLRGLPLFYVLSCVEPQPVPGLLTCETKPFEPKLKAGQKLAFRLRANPVVARREDGHKNSRHHDVLMDAKKAARAEGLESATEIRERMEDAAREWLGNSQRAKRAGYRLRTDPEVTRYQQHVQRHKGREIRFSSVDFEGLLRIDDPDHFLQALYKGIGRSRAFGCGLWLIRPA